MNRSMTDCEILEAQPTFGKPLETDGCTRTSFYHHYHSAKCDARSKLYDWSVLTERFQLIASRRREDRAYFYRHGATKYNLTNRVSGQHDTLLSELGRKQASALRESLPNRIDMIVCSTLFRTVETMTIGVPPHVRNHAPVVVDPRLNEVHLGILQGKRRRHLSGYEQGDLDFAPDQGESYRMAAQRVLSLIADLFDDLAATRSRPRTAVVFAHAGIMRIISTLVTGNDERDLFKTNHANTECLALPAERMHLPDYWNRTSHASGIKCHSF